LLPERVETFPMQALQSIQQLTDFLEEVEIVAIHQAMGMGASKKEIARALGVTRQGVDYELRRTASPKGYGEAEEAS
jgi:IS30 family transposase